MQSPLTNLQFSLFQHFDSEKGNNKLCKDHRNKIKVPDPAVKDLISKNEEPNAIKSNTDSTVGKLCIFYQYFKRHSLSSSGSYRDNLTKLILQRLKTGVKAKNITI